jgi:hypothetical protein
VHDPARISTGTALQKIFIGRVKVIKEEATAPLLPDHLHALAEQTMPVHDDRLVLIRESW